jgi:predicted PurR-regulated permease PerM
MTNKHWSETARYAALIAVIVGLVWLLSAARALVAPLVIAALLAYALMPAVSFLSARTRLARVAYGVILGSVFLVARLSTVLMIDLHQLRNWG